MGALHDNSDAVGRTNMPNNPSQRQKAAKMLYGDRDGMIKQVPKLSIDDSHDMYEVLELIDTCKKAASDNYLAALMLLERKASGQFANEISEVVKNLSGDDNVTEDDFCKHVRDALVNQYGTDINNGDDSEFATLMEEMREQLVHPPGKEKKEYLDAVASRLERNFRLWEGIVKDLWEKNEDGQPEGFTPIPGKRRAEAFIRAMPQKLKSVIKADNKQYESIQQVLRAARAKTNMLALLGGQSGNTMAASRMTRRSRSRTDTSDSETPSEDDGDDEVYTHADGASMMGSAGVKRFRKNSGKSYGGKRGREGDKGDNHRSKRNKTRRTTRAAAAMMAQDDTDDEAERNKGGSIKGDAKQIAAAILGKGACFGCGATGHWMVDCPTTKPGPAMPAAMPPAMPFPSPPQYPFTMFQQGNMNTSTPGNEQGDRSVPGRRPPFTCYGCGQVGHIKRNCPDGPQQRVQFGDKMNPERRRSTRNRDKAKEDRGRDRRG